MKIIIQLAAAERNLGGEDASAIDCVTGVGTLRVDLPREEANNYV
jgi:hypothetical protein